MRAQRGGAPIFLIIAVALAFGAGYGVYRLMKERRREAAIAEASAPRPRPAPPPREENVPDPEPRPVELPAAEPSLEAAQAGAADPPETDRALVAFGTPGTDGPLQRYRIEQAVKAQKSKFTRCLTLTEELNAGMLTVTLMVDINGKITSKALSAGGNAEFRKCVEEGLDRVVFDPTERPTAIVYPIRFGRPARAVTYD